MTNTLPIVGLSALFAGALVLLAAGPIAVALIVMGLPFIVLFVVMRASSHRGVDNGHFRSPDA